MSKALTQETLARLQNGGSHDIGELRNMLASSGIDNYTHAVCVIALDDELDLDGLTDAELERLIDTYADGIPGGEWDRNRAVTDALVAARSE